MTVTTAELRPLLKRLKLGPMLDTLPKRIALARRDGLDYADFLQIVLADEVSRRDHGRLELRLRQAGFEQLCRLEDFDWSAQVRLDRRLLDAACSLRFLDRREHVLLVGPAGVGKSFLAQALCYAAVRSGHSVRFVTADQYFRELAQARVDHSTEKAFRSFLAPDLLILDDLGLHRLSAQQSIDLYELVIGRHRSSSFVITSNRAVEEWLGLFDDPISRARATAATLAAPRLDAQEGLIDETYCSLIPSRPTGCPGGLMTVAELREGLGNRPVGLDRLLVGAGEDAHGAGLVAVAGDLAVVVAVGADEVGEQPGVAGVGLRASDMVADGSATPSARDVVAGRDQRRDPGAAVGLDADHDLAGPGGVLCDQFVQSGDPRDALGQPPGGEALAGFVHEMDVMVVLGPVVAHIQDHRPVLLRFEPLDIDPVGESQRRPNGTVLGGTTPHECCGTTQIYQPALGLPVAVQKPREP